MVDCIACTKFAALAPRLSGGISAISSSILILAIFRSAERLGTIYHRIMFLMSVADILFSVAIGLSTLPMPKDLPFEHPPYDGSRLGNNQTCEAQGFFYLFGLLVMFSYNAMLFVYNTFTITFQMKEIYIIKYVEPFLHLIPLTVGLAIAIPPFFSKLYSPTTWDAWCSLSAGTENDYTKNILKLKKIKNVDDMVIVLSGFFFSTILICGILIIWRVARVERELIGPNIKRKSPSANMKKASRSLQNSKVVAKQALAYLLSFISTAGIIFVRGLIDEPLWIIYLTFALTPLQGFFNLLIFISHKLYNYRRVYSDVSRCEVIKILFGREAHDEPVLFSRISLVRYFDDNKEEMSVEICDEKGSVLLHIHKNQEIISASESGGEAHFDDESKRSLGELDQFSYPIDNRSQSTNEVKISPNMHNNISSKVYKPNNSDETSSPHDINDNIPSFGSGLSGFSSELFSLERTISPGPNVSSHGLSPPSLGAHDGVSIDNSNESRGLFSLSMWKHKGNSATNTSTGSV